MRSTALLVWTVLRCLHLHLVTATQLTVPARFGGEAPTTRSTSEHASARHGLAAILPGGSDPLLELRNGLDAMQSEWFELWVGAWPSAIDWTGAVVNTLMVASLNTLSRALGVGSEGEQQPVGNTEIENELNLYFAQSAAYYFGENAFAIRNEAYDDMLWVVLGWLESTKFINAHCARHANKNAKRWHGSQYVTTYAHRARVFYDLASRGWDTTLCGGGMLWNPGLMPYKNAITNQLYISASVGMYLYFTGDSNSSPFLLDGVEYAGLEPAEPHDPQYLRAAIAGYEWLRNSNMTNRQGLYVDGFHVRGWSRTSNGTGKCDERNEMVYTYNQGVVLSGLRGLWESTGNATYLHDGYELLDNAISATGWNLQDAVPSNNSAWAGLGRHGILHELCDSSGRCDQDGQIFKGIFFNHLTLFCEPLPSVPMVPGVTFAADSKLAHAHLQHCQNYSHWVAHNARAALATRDERGHFGGWWDPDDESVGDLVLPAGAIDYRNDRSVLSPQMRQPSDFLLQQQGSGVVSEFPSRGSEAYNPEEDDEDSTQLFHQDLNDRGKGRTVETHASGVAVLRAMWELLNLDR